MAKIIFLNRFFYPDHSATSQMLSDLAFDLSKVGREVHVITSRLRYDEPTATLPSGQAIQGVQVHRVWTSRFGRSHLLGRAVDYLTFYTSAIWRLWRVTCSGDTVVAKTDPPLASLIAAPVARLRGARLINWLQDLFPEVAMALSVKGAKGPVGGLLRQLRNASLRRAEINAVLGERMADMLRRQGVRDSQIHILPNWADGEVIYPVPAAENSLRADWGLGNRFVVGYSGNMGRAHEFDTVMAAADLLRDHTDIVFLFIGGGSQRDKVAQAAEVRRLANVIFQPYQPRERLGQSLSAADVHLVSLQPALEGLIVPSKFYGIAAAGRATLFIGDHEGEIARCLRQADCGLTVAPGDGTTLAREILALANDRERCAVMGRNARVLLEQRFERVTALRAWHHALDSSAASTQTASLRVEPKETRERESVG